MEAEFTVNEPEIASVNPDDDIFRVFDPDALMVRLLNVVNPVASVLWLNVPPSVPVPVFKLAVTVTPEPETLLP